jgi:membrane associated rhomboid family serine protease
MVIPVHDENPVRRTPVVTYLLIAVNVVVFLLSPVATHVVGSSALAQQCRQEAFFDRYAAVPDELLQNRPLPRGATGEAARGGCVVTSPPPYRKEPWLSVLTAMFLHGGWLHLLGNMLFLYVFGNNVEDRLGRLRFLAFYLGCGYAATYGFAVFQAHSTQPLVGASGAIAGVLGAYLVLFPRAQVLSLLSFLFFLPVRLPAWVVLGGWFLLQYLYFRGAGVAEGSGVAYGAHVIGFLVGAGYVWLRRPAVR